MSFLKAIGDAITSPVRMISNAFGSGLNSITGATSAAKKSQEYSLESMAAQNAYEKEAAQNAHQWEIKDLEKAGLNPILSGLGGNGAQADTGISAGSQQGSGLTPLDLLQSLTSAGKTMREIGLIGKQEEKFDAEIENIDADTANKRTENGYIDEKYKYQFANQEADTALKKEQRTSQQGTLGNIIGGARDKDNKKTNSAKKVPLPAKAPYKHYTNKRNAKKAWEELMGIGEP